MKRRERMAVEFTRTHVFFYYCSNAEFDISTQLSINCKLSSYFLVRELEQIQQYQKEKKHQ